MRVLMYGTPSGIASICAYTTAANVFPLANLVNSGMFLQFRKYLVDREMQLR
jgi:hypothetical protein